MKNSSLGLCVGIVDLNTLAVPQIKEPDEKNSLKLTVACVDLKDALADESEEKRLSRVLVHLKSVSGLKPGIVMLPENFSLVNKKRTLSEIAQPRSISGAATRMISDYARQNHCYITCPLITRLDNKFFNSTILFGRDGKVAGIYDNMHPRKSELVKGHAFDDAYITPGNTNQPLISTSFCTIGIQMGEDAYYPESWQIMSQGGAKMILYSSLLSGGRILNHHAVSNHFYIVCCAHQEARIIDTSGNELDRSSDFIRYCWANLNTERTNIITFPNRLPELFSKYGNRLKLKVWNNTDMLTIESNDPALKVDDVLSEFELPTYAELINNETRIQKQYRPK